MCKKYKILEVNENNDDETSNIETVKKEGIEYSDSKLYELLELLKSHRRSFNVLYRNNIRSVEDLLKLTDEDIFKLRKAGKVIQSHIKTCIAEYLKEKSLK